ncbi:MAG: DUF4191 family protein [Micrococcales bacterium]|jgi:hypothetical protein|nr:DUF4191 family protein [Micrococcales bacterium]NBR78302.1 DUF4191 family protein [Microbacteriaceae bacterium]NBS86189.1 DUF4191 family protein [Micrococcales bacterium]NBX94418.1 DUF4191 family protein [Actinomycetota bacterium]
MAKEKKPKKSSGMFAQFGEQIRFLKGVDPKAVPLAIFIGVTAFVIITVLGVFISAGAFLGIVIWVVLGIVTGYLSALLTLTRRANTAIFTKYANEPGRISLTVGTLTRRVYKGTNQPVAVNARTRDMVFRIVGPAGVVLLGEGIKNSTQQLLEDERRKVQRVASGVTVHTFFSSEDGQGVPLATLHKKVTKLKRTLTKNEIRAVQNRLAAMDSRGGLPIPKGIDPTKMRPSKRIQ